MSPVNTQPLGIELKIGARQTSDGLSITVKLHISALWVQREPSTVALAYTAGRDPK